MHRRLLVLLTFVAVVLAVACGEKVFGVTAFVPTKGTVVLNGYGVQGVTLVPDTGTVTSSIAFGASFDGGAMRVDRDTVLTTSSKAGGDLLYIASLAAGTVKTIQMPAGSNPGAATVAFGSSIGTIAVTLRDSQAVAFVANPGSPTPTITLVRGIGTCPSDLFFFDDVLWVLDANQLCRTTYAVAGPSRLLKVTLTGATVTKIDTFPLNANMKSATNVVQTGEVAYIGGQGEVNYATVPPTVVTPGSIARFDLLTSSVSNFRLMPAGSFGTRVSASLEGSVYAFVYADPVTFSGRALRVAALDLAFIGPFAGTTSYLNLKAPDSTMANCVDFIGDVRGRLYCPVVGAASASRLYVYNSALNFIRNLPAGQGAVAVGSR